MNKNYYSVVQLFVLLFSFSTQAQLVSTNAALASAISSAVPGSTIIMADGVWTNVQVSIQKTGTAVLPVTLKAQTAGAVFIEGNSYIKMGGQYINVEGIVFQNPSNLNVSTSVITFKASSDCNNCKLTNVKIDTYNGTEAQSTSTFKWVLLYGSYNEISYCSFLGKYGVGSIINDNRSTDYENRTKIHHNYFADRTPVGVINTLNDQDAIRIGNSATSLGNSSTEVYDNFFNNFSGEVEVISNKSCYNKYYNNTFRDYQGTLTLRHGNNCAVFNNFFIANNKVFSGGIRVMGENHIIYNNYIEGVNSKKTDGSTSSATGGINVSNGKPNSALNEYLQVKNVTITNNTFVNCDYGLRIGTLVNSGLTLAPENLVVANNLIAAASVKAIQQTTAPTGNLSKYEGNIKQNGSWDITTGTNGNINVTSGLIASTKTDFFRLITGSAAVDKGMGTYSFLTSDITGGSRPTSFDVGAEELNSVGARVPYTNADVGVTIGFIPSPNLAVSKNVLANKSLILYPVPVYGNDLQISFNNNIGLVKVLDMQGKVLQQETIDAPSGSINVSKLPKGVYVLQTKSANKTFVRE